jgi:hypothetical protein
MCASKTTVVFSIVMACLIALETKAQNTAVGLYYPDFRAIKTIVNPKGRLNLPEGYAQDEMDAAWESLSTNGRDLLLQERDLALLVVDSDGNWLYRTSGLHTLKSVYADNTAREKEDLTNLMRILRNPWFQELRKFYNATLYARDMSPKRLGTLLASVDGLDQAGQDQKDWFRSVVGAEISQMDNVVRKGLLLDEKYGTAFVNAVAIAEAQRGQRLQMIAEYIEEGTDENIDVEKMAIHFGGGPDERPLDQYVNVISVGGKNLWEFNAHTGMVYASAKDDKEAPTLVPASFDSDALQRLLKEDRLQFYFAPTGAETVYRVKAGR